MARSQPIGHVLGAVALVACTTAGFAQTEPPPAEPDEEALPEEEEDADTTEVLDDNAVFNLVDFRARITGALLKHDPMEMLGGAWEPVRDNIYDTLGLRLGFAFTGLYQWSTNSEGGSEARGGDFDFYGTWRLVGSEEQGNAGYLGFATEWRGRIGNRPPSDLAAEFGGFSGTAQAFNDQDFSLVQLWWSQELFDRQLSITAGKISPRTFYNTNRLRNQNTNFLNQVFTGNRAIGLPGRGIGFNVTLRPNEYWYGSAGIHDTNATASTGDFRDLSSDNLAYIGELGWSPTFEGLGRGNYRLTLWHSDPSDVRGTDSGDGFALSLDQDLGEHLIGFSRYAWADGDARGAKQTLSGGLGLTDPFGRGDDLAAIGLGWSEPADVGGQDEYVVEVFYRMQLTPRQQLTVDWQTYIDPAFDPADDLVGVLGVRWRVQF